MANSRVCLDSNFSLPRILFIIDRYVKNKWVSCSNDIIFLAVRRGVLFLDHHQFMGSLDRYFYLVLVIMNAANVLA